MRRLAHATRRLVLRPYTRADHPRWRAAYVERLPARDRWDLGPLPPELGLPRTAPSRI